MKVCVNSQEIRSSFKSAQQSTRSLEHIPQRAPGLPLPPRSSGMGFPNQQQDMGVLCIRNDVYIASKQVDGNSGRRETHISAGSCGALAAGLSFGVFGFIGSIGWSRVRGCEGTLELVDSTRATYASLVMSQARPAAHESNGLRRRPAESGGEKCARWYKRNTTLLAYQ